ncbi:MAG: plastocyanin/azurin family copper-binding protein [Thermodesulfobacteriota bacterium]
MITIYLVSGYTIPVIEAQTKEIKKPAVTKIVSDNIKEEPSIEIVTNDESSFSQSVDIVEENKNKSKYHVIIIPNRKEFGSSQFRPEVITVKVNEKIVWINEDSRTHLIGTMVIEEYPTGRDEDAKEEEENDDDEEEDDEEEWKVPEQYFTSGYLANGAKFEHSFDAPGEYIYYCYVHPLEQRGKIIVVKD